MIGLDRESKYAHSFNFRKATKSVRSVGAVWILRIAILVEKEEEQGQVVHRDEVIAVDTRPTGGRAKTTTARPATLCLRA